MAEQRGTIVAIDPIKSGTSAAGKEWSNRQFRISWSNGNYENFLQLSTMKKDLIEQLDRLKVGDDVTCKFDVTSREWETKWYTEAKCFFIVSDTMHPASAPPPHPPIEETAEAKHEGTPPSDDLPF